MPVLWVIHGAAASFKPMTISNTSPAPSNPSRDDLPPGRRTFLRMLAAAGGSAALAACGGGGDSGSGADAVANRQRHGAGGASSASAPSSASSPAVSPATSRNPTIQPLASNCTWNLGIGSEATWSNVTDADNQSLISGSPYINSGEWSQPFYVGTATDPLVTVTCTDTLYPVPPQQIHIPAGATPSLPPYSQGGDAHMNFFDETQPTLMWSYWGCQGSTSTGFTAGLGSITNVCATDIIDEYNFGIGTIRQADVNSGVIPHELRFALSLTQTKSPGSTWTSDLPWPSTREDYDGPTAYTGHFVFGSTIGIPSSVNLASMGLTAGGLMLATALQKYGAIQRDTAGSGGITFYAEPSMEGSTVLTDMRSDLAKIVPYLRVMRNQSAATPMGGGTYPPAAPPLAGVTCTG
jgi:hypothetical protein